MKLLLAGFGHVGRRVADILANRDRYPGLADFHTEVVAIVTGSHGALHRQSGIDLQAALDHFRKAGSFAGHTDQSALDARSAAQDLDYDVLVELSPLTVADRGEPALSHVRAALSRGLNAVTANKGPVAWGYRELATLAARHGCHVLFEGTVMDGLPVFNLTRHCLRGTRVVALEGILNSTTNVVLQAMEQGTGLSEAVADAQRLGVAETDPSADLEGWDAAVKLSILVQVLMAGQLQPEDIPREPVTADTARRAIRALRKGHRLKLVCSAEKTSSGVRAEVALRELPARDPFSLVVGTSSILRLHTDLPGTMSLTEETPDLYTTAYAVISDLLSLAGTQASL